MFRPRKSPQIGREEGVTRIKTILKFFGGNRNVAVGLLKNVDLIFLYIFFWYHCHPFMVVNFEHWLNWVWLCKNERCGICCSFFFYWWPYDCDNLLIFTYITSSPQYLKIINLHCCNSSITVFSSLFLNIQTIARYFI